MNPRDHPPTVIENEPLLGVLSEAECVAVNGSEIVAVNGSEFAIRQLKQKLNVRFLFLVSPDHLRASLCEHSPMCLCNCEQVSQ